MGIKDWFVEKDYGIGLVLFGQNSKNRILLQNLIRKQNPAKLEYELRKIAEHQGIDLTTEAEDLNEEKTDPNQPGKIIDLNAQTTESHSDQVIDQMNAETVVGEKLQKLEDNADEIVSEKLDNLESDAGAVVSEKLKAFEAAAEEIISGKLQIIRDGKVVSFEQLPLELQARWNQNRDGYKEIRSLHEKLKLMANASDSDRQPLTQRIADLDEIVRDNWVIIDAWKPAEASHVEAIDHKRIQANRKYISTNLKKLTETADPVKAAKIVAELQLRFDELKASGEAVTQETIDELAKVGVKC